LISVNKIKYKDMKKVIFLFLAFILVGGFGFVNYVNGADVCMEVSGCEGEESPRDYPHFFSNDFRCSWYLSVYPNLYFDECRAGGKWFYYGPDDAGEVDGYVCYNCDNMGENCDVVRSLINGNSQVVCYNCDCRDHLSNFPPPLCTPITGSKCVDEKCCVQEGSFTDFRDGETYSGNHGKYSSCVAQARKECGLIPSADELEIQRKAAKEKFNPSFFIDFIVSITLILVIYIIWFLQFRKKK
jgi:hypothetical protein